MGQKLETLPDYHQTTLTYLQQFTQRVSTCASLLLANLKKQHLT